MKKSFPIIVLSMLLLVSCTNKENDVEIEEKTNSNIETSLTADEEYFNLIYLPLETAYSKYSNSIFSLDSAVEKVLEDKDSMSLLNTELENYKTEVNELTNSINLIVPISSMDDSQITLLDNIKNYLLSSIDSDNEARLKIAETVLDDGDLGETLLKVEEYYDSSDKFLKDYYLEKEKLHSQYEFNRLPYDNYTVSNNLENIVEPTEDEKNIYHDFIENALIVYGEIDSKYSTMAVNKENALNKESEIQLADDFLLETLSEKYKISIEELKNIIEKVEMYELFG